MCSTSMLSPFPNQTINLPSLGFLRFLSAFLFLNLFLIFEIVHLLIPILLVEPITLELGFLRLEMIIFYVAFLPAMIGSLFIFLLMSRRGSIRNHINSFRLSLSHVLFCLSNNGDEFINDPLTFLGALRCLQDIKFSKQ